MKTRMFALLALALVMGGCQKDSGKSSEGKPGLPVINAEVETGLSTRTLVSVDESGTGTIFWKPSDEINVFFGTEGARYVSKNTQNAASATFRTTDELDLESLVTDNIWGLYPYDKKAACDGSSVTTTLPAAQRGIPESFDDDLFINLAHSSSNTLKFFNVCSGVKFSLTRSDIASVTFRGNGDEDIAGDISLTFEDGAPKATVVNGLKSITLTPRYGSTFTKDANYYIITLPVTLSQGFTITFTTVSGTVGTFEYTDKPVTLKRSTFGKKADFDTFASFVGITSLTYTTSDGQMLKLPYPDRFGAAIASHTYENGVGTITFDAPVSGIGEYAFSRCSTLTSITLPEGLTSIGRYAFEYCTGLTSLVIPDSVTELGDNLFYQSGVTSVSLGSVVETRQLQSPLANTNNLSVTVRDGVVKIGDQAFSGCSFMTSISLPDGLTGIGRSAFVNCTGLMSFVIPASVTSIGESAFIGCTGLTTMEIPSGVTSLAPSTFMNCTGLTSITLPEGLTSIGRNTFSHCSGLTSFTIPETVTSLGQYAFEYCTGLTSMVIPDSVTELGNNLFYQSGVTSVSLGSVVETRQLQSPLANTNNLSVTVRDGVVKIGDQAFSSCSFMTSISLPDGLTGIGRSAFVNCTGLTSFAIPASVTSIGESAFIGCTGLTTMEIPSGVTSLAPSTFMNCTGLTSITLPEGLTSIGRNTFSHCSGLTSFTIPETVTSLGQYAFEYCTGLTSMVIPDSVTELGNNLFYQSGVTSVSLGSIVESRQMQSPLGNGKKLSVTVRDGVVKIGDQAFSSCSFMTSISLPDGLTGIGRSAFVNCTGLTSFAIPASVTSIGESAFLGCTGLTTMAIPSGVTSLAPSTFMNCTGLTSITLPEGLTSIGGNAFSHCSGLTSFTIPETVTSLGGYAFEYCTGLTSLVIPDSVTELGSNLFYQSKVTSVSLGTIVEARQLQSPLANTNNLSVTVRDGVKKIGDSAFSGCSFMTSISLPDGLTGIGRSAFVNCKGLMSFAIPASVTSIGESAFLGCTGLTTMEIPSGVTNLAPSTFMNCTGLTSITLPEGLTSIGSNTFSHCSGLTSFTIPETVTSLGQYAFEYCTGLTEFKCQPVTPPAAGSSLFYNASECPIYVPSASVDAYKAAQNWSPYASRIQAMI